MYYSSSLPAVYLRPIIKMYMYCFFNDTAPTEIYTYGHPLSLHDALPISLGKPLGCGVHRCDELNPSPCLPLHLTHRHAPFSQCGWFHLLACHDVMSKSL